MGCRCVAAGLSHTYIDCISRFGFHKDPSWRKEGDDQKGADVWMQAATLPRKTALVFVLFKRRSLEEEVG